MSDPISKYITAAATGNDKIDSIINNMVYPAISMFCEIPVYYETGARMADGNYKFSYPRWNPAFLPEVFLNGSDTQLGDEQYEVDFDAGIITPQFESETGDNVLCTYNFSWFTPSMLSGFITRSISTLNYAGNGATTSYTIDNLPEDFWGITTDLVIAMSMENLILGYTMWVGKLIFSISPNGLYDGNDSVVAQLETIKRNCEERAYKAIENPQFRAPHRTIGPTAAYWRSVTMGNGVRIGPHGQTGYGKTKGIVYNKLVGMTGPDLGV